MLIDPVTFRRLVRARELLASEEHDALGIREVAARVTLSPYHFIRVFGAVFGDTPHQFRTRMRLERAKQLLAAGGTVTDACFEVGFASVGSFSSLFTRWVGAPPSAYRRIAPVVAPGCLGLLAQLPSNSREALRA